MWTNKPGNDWEKILDLVPNVIGYIDKDLHYRAANRAFEEWMEVPRGEMVGRDARELITERFGAEVFDRIEPKLRAALRGKRSSLEHTVMNQGEARTICLEYVPDIDDLSGEVHGVVVVITDMTERKRAEEAVRASEELFRGLSTSNPAGIFRADLNGNISYVNAQVVQDWQLSAEECMGRGWTRRVHPDDLAPLLKGWVQAISEERDYDQVYRIVLDTGEIRWVHGRSSPIRDAKGRLTGSVGTVYDVTSERRAHEASLKSQDRFRRIFEDVPVAMAISDPATMKIILPNSAASRLFGYSIEELSGMSIDAISHPDDIELDQAQALKVMSGEINGYVMEKRFRTRQGREAYGLLTVSTVRGDREGERLLLGMVIDITEQRRLEMQHRQSMKMEAVGQLAGGIAHDFNNLLMIVNSYAELLTERYGPDSDVGKKAHAIEDAGKRAAQLTQQLLAFSRQQHLQSKVLDLNSLVRNAEKMLRRLIREDISLRTDFPIGDLRVKADPGQIEQVLLNLVVNARDATRGQGEITIRTSRTELTPEEVERFPFRVPPGRYVELAVADTGQGMSEETKAHVFEPFFTTKEAGKGTGMGLSTVYGIVKQSGGWVICDSVLGKGTTFRILFPEAAGELSEEPISKRSVIDTRRTGTILLVEDEDAVRDLLAVALSGLGYEVIVASNGEEALRIGEQVIGQVDLLVTDTVMPRMGGYALARSLWQKRPSLRVLFMSGYIEALTEETQSPDRKTAVLQKPFSTALLNQTIAQLLEESEDARATAK
jgi:PAS domain S-box-containing protein